MSASIKNRPGKIISLLATLLLLAGLIFTGIWFWRPPEANSPKRRADIKISSADLIDSFRNDENTANASYVEKVLEVEGVVKEITFFNDRYTVLLQGEDSFSCIMCDMQEDQLVELQALEKGDTVVLKGICKGFLMDAILLNCILITNP